VFAEGPAGLLGCRRTCHGLALCIGCGVHTPLVILAALRVFSLAGFAFLSLHASGIIAILALHARLAICRQRVARHLLHILRAEAFFAVNASFDARSSWRRREIKRRQADRERERERAFARSIVCAFFNALATLSRAQHPIWIFWRRDKEEETEKGRACVKSERASEKESTSKRPREREQDQENKRERERERESKRETEKEQEREREREKDKDRVKKRERKKRDKEKETERERKREKETRTERERERQRERER